MTLVDQYNAAISQGTIEDCSFQRAVLARMQLLANNLKKKQHLLLPFSKKKPIQGLYLYGPVGAGKTYLMDLFYQQVAERKKARFHFHHFMQQIHSALSKHQGQKDPLPYLAKQLAQTIRLLCLDEFLVNDVATAMILGEFLQALLEQGIVLVISSNTAPDNLYLNGVQRERFLPAIALIKTRCEVIYLEESRDYRLGRAPALEAYLCPLNAKTQQTMEKQFTAVTKNATENGIITVQQREIPYIKCASRAIWFDFSVLCDLPRSQLDYLEISQRFDSVFLSNIPLLTENHTAQVILFILLIDVLYDRGIQLILSAAAPLDKLYLQGEMSTDFQRTSSRLSEMQSKDYNNKHRGPQILSTLTGPA